MDLKMPVSHVGVLRVQEPADPGRVDKGVSVVVPNTYWKAWLPPGIQSMRRVSRAGRK